MRRAWAPWLLLSILVFIWGTPQAKRFFNGTISLRSAIGELGVPLPQRAGLLKLNAHWTAPEFKIVDLNEIVLRSPPVAPAGAAPEKAVFSFNWVSATGTGILVAALLAGALMGFRLSEMRRVYWETLVRVRFSLITIAAMLALGYITRYSGTDATMGLALARTGALRERDDTVLVCRVNSDRPGFRKRPEGFL